MWQNSDNGLDGTEKMPPQWSELQEYVDIHCHCLPAVDDGPATRYESLSLCQALADDCVATVVATPHQLGRFSGCNEASQIRKEVSLLNEGLKDNGVALTVVPGGDIRVDERICQLLEEDRILTLADGGKYILLELPHQIFIDIEPLFGELASLGIQAIISHPERHPVLMRCPQILEKWFNLSVNFQVTAGSLLGDFGSMTQQASWHFLSRGLALLVATDSHDISGRRPRMRAAFECISAELGRAAAQLVCVENPLRVLKGQAITAGLLCKRREV